MEPLTLYTYSRSSAAYRVRIVLNYKTLAYRSKYIRLTRDGGENNSPEYKAVNAQALIPSLQTEHGVITQSMAIMEYLEQRYPQPPMLPLQPENQAQVRAYAQLICCDIHPLNNLRVLAYLQTQLHIDDSQQQVWYRHWIEQGFAALETVLSANSNTGIYCFGDTPTLADACLVPQVYNANRFNCDMSAFPTIRRINAACLTLPAFQQARPENQADFTA
jgi:maleylacetoacetate isomerase